MKRRLKMRERRSLRRYYETFGGTLNLAALAYRFTAAVLPILAVIGLAAYAMPHLEAHSTHGLVLAAAGAVAVPVMTQQSKELRQQRNKLIQEMHDLTEKSGFPEEAQKRWKELDGQQKAIDAQVRAIEETAKLEEEMRKINAPPQAQPGVTPENRGPQPGAETADKAFRAKLESKEYRTAFFNWFRFGNNDMNQSERSLLHQTSIEARTYAGLSTSTSGDAAGYVIPIGFQRELETKMKAYGRMLDNVRTLTTSTGNILDWPTVDDTANSGEYVAEAGPVSQVNPSFGQVQFASYLASSKQVLMSVQLLQDSAFDLEAYITDAFAIRLGRLINNKLTVGNGSGCPTGIVYAIQNDSVPNVVNATGSNSNDGITGNTEANSVGSDDLDDLINAVDPAYRPGAKFMMHWATIDGLRKLKDKYGRPLWTASLADNEPDRIWGYPFDWNADMDKIGAGKYPILFGDFSKYIYRKVSGMTMVRFNELYMPNHQIGFQAFERNDGKRLQQAAFSLLYNPLS